MKSDQIVSTEGHPNKDLSLALSQLHEAEQANLDLKEEKHSLRDENEILVSEIQNALDEIQELLEQNKLLSRENIRIKSLYQDVLQDRDNLAEQLNERSFGSLLLSSGEINEQILAARCQERSKYFQMASEYKRTKETLLTVMKQRDDFELEVERLQKLLLKEESKASNLQADGQQTLGPQFANMILRRAIDFFVQAENNAASSTSDIVPTQLNRGFSITVRENGSLEISACATPDYQMSKVYESQEEPYSCDEHKILLPPKDFESLIPSGSKQITEINKRFSLKLGEDGSYEISPLDLLQASSLITSAGLKKATIEDMDGYNSLIDDDDFETIPLHLCERRRSNIHTISEDKEVSPAHKEVSPDDNEDHESELKLSDIMQRSSFCHPMRLTYSFGQVSEAFDDDKSAIFSDNLSTDILKETKSSIPASKVGTDFKNAKRFFPSEFEITGHSALLKRGTVDKKKNGLRFTSNNQSFQKDGRNRSR